MAGKDYCHGAGFIFPQSSPQPRLLMDIAGPYFLLKVVLSI
jgi:hypothetical protein